MDTEQVSNFRASSVQAKAAGLIAAAVLLCAALLSATHRQANASHALSAPTSPSAEIASSAGANLPNAIVPAPFDPATRVLPDELPPGY